MTITSNPIHCALFSLPPIQPSASTDLTVPHMPAQKVVTGDVEIDAVLWLREVISTGNADLIAKAKEAAARIKTPLNQLEKRYADWIHRTKPDDFGALLFSFGFSDLDGLAGSATAKALRQQEARARFGDAIFDDIPAERFCMETLADMPLMAHYYDAEDADMMFDACHDQRPSSLADCLLELEFWHQLYWLRDAVGGTGAGDSHAAITAREDYIFRMLSRIPPRSVDEAAEVFRYLTSNDGMDRAHTGAIILNLIGAPEPYKAKRGDAQ